MKTMTWLIRREFWEHKGMFFWAPLVVSAALTLFLSATMMYAAGKHGLPTRVTVDGTVQTVPQIVAAMTVDDKIKLSDALVAGAMLVSGPIFVMLCVTLFFYCLGAMFDERRDRSILFWKSLPVSDSMTVASKVATALLLAPLITFAFAFVTSFVLTLVACSVAAWAGLNVFGLVLGNGDLYLAPLRMLATLPVYILWALPTVGWLVMVSSWARSKVFLWAVGAPLLALGIVKWANHLYQLNIDVDWIAHNVLARGLLGLVPGIWFPLEQVPSAMLVSDHAVSIGSVFTQSWMTMASPSAWIGGAVGVAMLAVAVRLRRWRDEG